MKGLPSLKTEKGVYKVRVGPPGGASPYKLC